MAPCRHRETGLAINAIWLQMNGAEVAMRGGANAEIANL
jgi:hypothetical protein